MEDKQTGTPLPDISGVFDIDESSIPTDMIAPDTDSASRAGNHPPILLNDPEQIKQNKKEQKKKNALKKAEKREAKRKRARKRLIIAAVFVGVVAAAVFGVKFAVDNSRRPTGEVVRAYTGSIAEHYDTRVLLTSAVIGQGQVGTAAVFSENDYDIYSVSKGLSARITLDDGSEFTGTVTDISREPSDSAVMEKIRTVFPDGEYSSGMNYVITVTADSDAAAHEDVTADIRVITAESDETVLVPSTAVHKDGAKFYVWTYKPFTKTAQKQEVSVGIEADGVSEITKGLKTDTRVVAVFDCGDDMLTDSLKIKVKDS